jgi:uncharacterized membrane protein
MDGFPIWPIAGLTFGTVCGIAGVWAGFPGFIIVLVLGVIGFLIGRLLEGSLDLSALTSRRR